MSRHFLTPPPQKKKKKLQGYGMDSQKSCDFSKRSQAAMCISGATEGLYGEIVTQNCKCQDFPLELLSSYQSSLQQVT